MVVGLDQRAEKDFGASAPGVAIATGRALTHRRPAPREPDSTLGHNRPFTAYEHELEPLHPRAPGRLTTLQGTTPQPRGVFLSTSKES